LQRSFFVHFGGTAQKSPFLVPIFLCFILGELRKNPLAAFCSIAATDVCGITAIF